MVRIFLMFLFRGYVPGAGVDKDGRGLGCCIVAKWAGSMAVRDILFGPRVPHATGSLHARRLSTHPQSSFGTFTHFWLEHVGTDGGRYAALFFSTARRSFSKIGEAALETSSIERSCETGTRRCSRRVPAREGEKAQLKLLQDRVRLRRGTLQHL